MAEPDTMRRRLDPSLERGFKAFKIGWGPFGRVDSRKDESIVKAARETAGAGLGLAWNPEAIARFTGGPTLTPSA